MSDRKEIHERVLNAANKEELAEAYAEWADSYDRDLVDEMAYVAPALTLQLLQEYLEDKQARILDAGCGTGLVGLHLLKQGFEQVEGLDYSLQMLAKAKEKGVYTRLHQGDLTATLELPEAHFDAVICVGTFTCGHVGPEAFSELLRVTRPGGYICFTVRDKAWQDDDYSRHMEVLEKRGDWACVEERTSDYIRQEGSSCKICLYRKRA